MDYLKEIQRRVKETELSRWVNYFLQIPFNRYFFQNTEGS
jgi:hypothetical protein